MVLWIFLFVIYTCLWSVRWFESLMVISIKKLSLTYVSADRNQNQNCLSPEQETDWTDTGISLQQGSISGPVKSKPSDWASPPLELPCGHSGFCNATTFPAVPQMQHLPGTQDVGNFFICQLQKSHENWDSAKALGPKKIKSLRPGLCSP